MAGPRRSGTEPRHARSDLPLRRTLSLVFGALFAVGAAAFALLAWRTVPGGSAPNRDTYVFFAALCAAFAAVAAVDLAVVARRMSRDRPPYGR
ncbi:DUF6343 family protein [Streptacidiphilus sp. ASG 303]|uniref:DUF6343 family protein n=1 Tax=Streptomycetaceae TaxID=2062 RepID=UPI001E4B4CEC|nr:DUF6343 family protein [Streptacidiphilus sp. ASG 303]MCD0483480.1 DUF6343 family protein [Streptacidiphilus sp. ASG 303]